MRKRKFMIAGATAVLVGGLLAVGTVLAVHDEGMQLEGNATAADLTYTDLDVGAAPRPGVLEGAFAGPYDWDSLVTIAGTPAPGNALGAATPIPDADLPDGFTNSDFQKDFNNTGTTFLTFDTTTFATGSKDTLPITPGWQCNRDANVNSKIDIMNGFAAVMEKGAQRFLYFGLEKAKDTGNNNVGMWLLQDPSVGCTSTGGAVPFSGNHVVGDLLIVSAFTNGGGVSAITAYEWIADIDPKPNVTTPGINPNPVATSADCLDIGGSGATDRLCAVVNGQTISMPWLTADNGVINAPHPSPNFWEGGIELTAFSQFAGTCFNRYILNTRSSQSLTATLFDYVQGQLNTCAPSTNLTKTASATTAHSGDSVTYTYVETNDGNVVLTSPSVEDDSCAPVTYVSGDSNNDGKLDPGEAWTFTCTATITATTTNTAIGHGFSGTNDVTWCSDETTPPANTICDQDERAQQLVTVLNPATTLTLKSQTPADPIYADTEVTIVVTETNTGDDILTGVSVTGSGCTPWTAVDITFDGTLDPGESQDFTCTYTPGVSGSWSADGQGTDSGGNPVPATNEHVEGTVVVINPSTILTKAASVDATITYTYTETNDGDVDLTTPAVTDDKCASVVAVDLNTDGFNDGDTNSDGILSVGETWLFTCTTTITGITTSAELTNVAIGDAHDPNGLHITPPFDPDETDTTTVNITITNP